MAITLIDDFMVIYSSNSHVPRIGLVAGGDFIGQLLFEPNGAALPPDGEIGNQVNLYYHQEDYANALDLLRSDAPTYLLFNGTGPGFENAIMTSQEVVGAGEKVRS
jgi:hypothetical protein